MRLLRRLCRYVPLLAVVLIFLGPAAFAAAPGVTDETPQQGAKTLQVSKIDASDVNNVSMQFTWNGDVSKLQTLTIRQDGTQIQASQPQLFETAGINRATVLVLDISGSMVTNGGLNTAVTKMKQLIAASPAGDQFGIVSFGSTAQVTQSVTSDRAQLDKSLDSIKSNPQAHTATWDGIATATSILAGVPKLQHNLILVTDGADDSSKSTAAQARGSVIGNGSDAGATVFAIGLSSENQLDKTGLSNLVAAGGGRFFVAAKPADVAKAFDEVSVALKNEYVVKFVPLAGNPGRNKLTLNIGGFSAPASFTLGGVQSGASSLAPQFVAGPSGPAFLRTTGGLLLGLLLVALAVGVACYVAFSMVTSRNSLLDAALSPYAEGYSAENVDSDEHGGLAQTALLQRAVAMTEGFAERQGFLEAVEHKLEMAEIPLKAAEVLLIWVAGIILLTILGFLLSGLVIAVVVLILTIIGGPAFLNLRSRMRARKFEQQLPDMLTLMAGALRAGFSLMQGVDAVSVEVQDPMGRELRRVVSESRLGRQLEDALDDVAERTGSADFAWAVMAIRIQREVGGNLAELLMTVAETMVQRERLRREIKSLTAEGRISAIVLTALSPLLGLAMYVMNPSYMKPLFSELLGQVMLIVALVAMVIGYFWMRKVVQIDV